MSEDDPSDDATGIEKDLGHHFRDRALLETALTHASYAYDEGAGRGNERLEFLGDAVLDLVIAHLLYDAHPEWSEGELTRARSSLVSRQALAERARGLSIGRYVRLGRAERRSAGEEKDTILADCLEALFGAVYMDGGLDAIVSAVRHTYGGAIDERAPMRDPKTRFQEWCHAERQETPSYRTTFDSGEENDERRFTVEVWFGGESCGSGSGRSKRSAERNAARDALERRDDSGR